MTRQGRLHDRPRTRQRYSAPGRAADWGNAVIVALVLSAVVVMAAMAIAVYDNSAVLASRQRTTASELPKTAADGGGLIETEGRAR